MPPQPVRCPAGSRLSKGVTPRPRPCYLECPLPTLHYDLTGEEALCYPLLGLYCIAWAKGVCRPEKGYASQACVCVYSVHLPTRYMRPGGP